jgi:hypothetical protein
VERLRLIHLRRSNNSNHSQQHKERAMPFKKVTSGKDKGKFKGPSGKVFNKAQVALYYAKGGKFPAKKR